MKYNKGRIHTGFINGKIINLYKELSHQEILESRKNRNWNEFDNLDISAKASYILKELTIYKNFIKS
jgi:hypothetical protein